MVITKQTPLSGYAITCEQVDGFIFSHEPDVHVRRLLPRSFGVFHRSLTGTIAWMDQSKCRNDGMAPLGVFS